ncbi:hypothetical protein [Pseudoalteromonas sp. S1688]|uniref:hypothetical protein n=1 Tax=Pseudoalteromonas sp. S1688 TaxID=579511 RepID=UPI00110B3735|nr:hypothetical protein [Pseudoalteromonas sp. S1688]
MKNNSLTERFNSVAIKLLADASETFPGSTEVSASLSSSEPFISTAKFLIAEGYLRANSANDIFWLTAKGALLFGIDIEKELKAKLTNEGSISGWL